MNEPAIDPEIQILLQFAGEEALTRTIWSLSAAQKKSHIFRQLGEQRYLSALRSGGIDNAEMTKLAFSMDPYFLRSKLVMDAAKAGFDSEIGRGNLGAAEKIKHVMGLEDDIPPLPTTSKEMQKEIDEETPAGNIK
jgi:hypothetical protein